jgi:hypothetical protein
VFPAVPPAVQTDKWKALKPHVKAVNVPKWAQRSQESICESGGEVRDGAGKRVMECEMCTEKRQGGKGLGKAVAVKIAEVQNIARHVLRNGAVALRAALESAVQLGRGDEGDRQAEMAKRNVGIRYRRFSPLPWSDPFA